eukprot:GEMP01018406.1.p1 GENE.GEMP01018406.1~~GEMP01018406.1.p1  ORF type:complete len:263 (+),score=38.83 GEMP01018406.1:23-811(+)
MVDDKCTVLSGPFSYLMQGILLCLVVLTLVFKKIRENRKLKSQRTWREFALDASKQAIGSGWVHILNLLFAMSLERRLQTGDECAWYFINIVIDCTLGVFAAKLWLNLLLRIKNSTLSEERAADLEPGNYYDSAIDDEVKTINKGRYIKQLAMWLVVVSLMKLSMLVVMLTMCAPLQVISSFILQPVIGSPKLELIVVMCITPFLMNALQFWLFDNFLKKKEKPFDVLEARDSVSESGRSEVEKSEPALPEDQMQPLQNDYP